jgi:pSer/pThr/pTyr-binding forkhead associated (FHA) protein
VVKERAVELESGADSGFRSRAGVSYALREGQLEHKFTKGPLVIGRGAGAHVILKGALVSRRHAELSVTDRGIVIADLGSQNGVFVNGRKISVPVALVPGDVIAIGETTLVLSEVSDPAARHSVIVSELQTVHRSERVSVGT